jgi:hypothetical protein
MPPKAVEDLAAQAEKLHREMYPEQYGDPPKTPEPPQGDTPPAPPADPPTSDPNTPAEPPAAAQPEPPAAPPAEPPATPPAAPEPPAPNWEDKYNSLQGKYNAEVPRLSREIAELRNTIAALQQAPQPPAAPPKPPADEVPPELKEKLATFAEDYPDVAEGLQAMLQIETAKIRREAAQEIEKVRAEASIGVQNTMYTELERRVPDWKVIRDDPSFAAWLQNVDPFSGRPLSELAQVALQEMDINRIVAFYDGFKQMKQVASPTPSTHEPTPTPPAAPASNPAAQFVAPPRSSGSPPPNPNPQQNETITSAFIAKFYNDAAMGKYRGRDAEYNAIETKIDKAIKSGRVVRG